MVRIMEKIEFTIIPITTAVCVDEIIVTLEQNTDSQESKLDMRIESVLFKRGCFGQGKAVSKLLKGRTLREASELLKGITCGARGTSCSDQLAIGIDKWVSENCTK